MINERETNPFSGTCVELVTLAGGEGWGFCLDVNAQGGADAGSRRRTVPLVGERFFNGGEELQHEGLLTAVAHQAQAPDLVLEGAKAAGDFDVEFVQKLVAEFCIVDA